MAEGAKRLINQNRNRGRREGHLWMNLVKKATPERIPTPQRPRSSDSWWSRRRGYRESILIPYSEELWHDSPTNVFSAALSGGFAYAMKLELQAWRLQQFQPVSQKEAGNERDQILCWSTLQNVDTVTNDTDILYLCIPVICTSLPAARLITVILNSKYYF